MTLSPALGYTNTRYRYYMRGYEMSKGDFDGFASSFDAYCKYCDGLDVSENSLTWGQWWDSLEDKATTTAIGEGV